MDLDDFRQYTEWHDVANRRRYEAPADPWRLVPVDPDGVDRFAVVSLLWGLGRVRGGDWDRPGETRSLDDTRMIEGLRQRFEGDRDWTDTVYHEWVRERIEEEGRFRRFESIADVEAEWFPAVDELFESMREDGYRPNRGTVYDDPGDIEFVHEMEPLVLVGRDGEVIWTEGFHRLTLARILDVDAVPVHVLRRHEGWQEVRDRLARTEPDDRPPELEAYADHPDVVDVA